MVRKYPEVASILKENIYTDIPVQNLTAFVELVERVQKSKISSVALTAKQGIYSSNPDYDLVRKLVEKGIAPPKATPKPTSSTSEPTKTPTGSATDSYEEC
jgi:hypothetical protein